MMKLDNGVEYDNWLGSHFYAELPEELEFFDVTINITCSQPLQEHFYDVEIGMDAVFWILDDH